MEPVQTTPPVQTPLALLYAPAMKGSRRMTVCALVRFSLSALKPFPCKSLLLLFVHYRYELGMSNTAFSTITIVAEAKVRI